MRINVRPSILPWRPVLGRPRLALAAVRLAIAALACACQHYIQSPDIPRLTGINFSLPPAGRKRPCRLRVFIGCASKMQITLLSSPH